jgi:23S rRNA pseudoU1915 N3-methylase RlmH
MKVSVLSAGKPRGARESIIRELEVRAARYGKLEIIEVESGSGDGARRDPQVAQTAEGKRFLARVPEGSQKWALTCELSRIHSLALVAELGDMALAGVLGVSFLLGAAFGLDGDVLAQAHRQVCPSLP